MVETPFEMIPLIRRLPIAIGLVAIVSLAGCNPTPVTIAPPRVQQGGRALSIAVASTNEKRMVVATETGGLFRTFDGGASWQHLDNLPNFRTRSEERRVGKESKTRT